MSAYTLAILKELDNAIEPLQDYLVRSIYFGGGTPSYLPPTDIQQILEKCRAHLLLSSDLEVTLESNPEDISENSVTAYAQMGINRLSLGIQAWQPQILEFLGRKTSTDLLKKSLSIAQKSSIPVISHDLIFGIPGQTLADWEESLSICTSFAPQHISCYSLEIHPGSTFGQLHAAGRFPVEPPELDRQMSHLAEEFLANRGYQQYEISNYAQPNAACLHNQLFWQNQPYWGFGAGAHSFVAQKRWCQPENINQYLKQIMSGEPEPERITETNWETAQLALNLALRTAVGVDLAGYNRQFGHCVQLDDRVVAELKASGHLHSSPNFLILTRKGRDVSDWIVQRLVK